MNNTRPCLYPRRRLGSLVIYALTSLCLLSAAAWALTTLSVKIIEDRQAKLVDDLRKNVADSPAFLVERLRTLQLHNISLFVPGMKIPVSFPVGMISFDPKTFPQSFLDGLVFEVEHGSPVYHLKLREVRATREIEVLNAGGKVFYVFKPSSDYDPRWLARQKRPQIYAASFPTAQRAKDEEELDPSHVEMEITLITDDYVEVYAEDRFASLMDVLLADSPSKSLSGGMSMMRMAGSETNIVVAQIGMVSSGRLLQVDYPDTLTNRLEMMISSNLMPRQWWVADTNLVTAGTNTLQWVDTGSTNGAGISNRFYRVGNSEDTDGDGIAGGREAIIYHTNPDALDSDGDGLVDGYSGVVSTNTYPGGVTTNGSTMVLGELSLGTDPTLWDTDGDGMGDGWEVAHGHNPLDPNDPPNVSGTLIYPGRQTGTVWVIAVTDSNSWSTGHSYTSSASGFPLTYFIPDLEQTNYWLKAWVDSIGNGQTNATEARGVFTNVLTVITNRVTGKGFTLVDPDNDSDGLPDWWEIACFGNVTNTAAGDPDGDEYSNQEEYNANTDPTNILNHPWDLSGTITYTGPQTGIIHVVACTNGTDWAWVYADTLTNSMTYTITHLPPNAYYWVRAWRDSNVDTLPTSWEAWGSHNSNPVFLNANLTGQDITLADPDDDEDGLPDWWEVLYGLDPTRGGGSGLSAWWKLDEGAGTNVFDTTSNANHGVLMSVSNAWASGIISNGLSLNGTNDYIAIPDGTTLKPNQISVGLWVKPSRLYTNGTAMFLSKRVTNGTAGYSLGYETGAVTFTVGASGIKSQRYSCALTADTPVHVAGTFGSSAQSLYINGTRVATTNYDWGLGFGAISQDTNVLRIGSASGAIPTNFFAGLLDDVRVFPGEWTTNQVHAIWELGADPDQDGLSNTEEYKHGTNPTNSDSDADGMLDGAEVKYGLNPLVADAMADKDGDGYLNIYEIKRGSEPSSSNSIPSPTHIVTNGVSTIQAMINSVTQDYAVVQVKAGTYSGAGNTNLDFGGKKLMLVSESGASNTVIDCQYAGRGFYFHSGETILSVVKGLTITKGQASIGAAMMVSNASPWITECAIVGNRMDYMGSSGAGAVVLVNSGAKITACRIEGNGGGDYGTMVDRGGGLYIVGGTPCISNTVIVGNQALFDGGGLWMMNSTGIVVNCEIVSNNAVYGDGGGIWSTGLLAVANSRISGNGAMDKGGGICSLGAAGKCGTDECPVMADAQIVSNTAMFGGGFYHEQTGSSPLTISNSVVSGNSAVYGAGGIEIAGGSGSSSLVQCDIERNMGLDVGGIKINGGAIRISRCLIAGNMAGLNNGGFYANSTGHGTLIESTAIVENRAPYGGAGGFNYEGYIQNCLIASNVCDNPYEPGGVVGRGTPNCVTVRNGIVWGNSGDQLASGINAIYSCVQGGYTNNASSNIITNDPRLMAGYRLLSPSSPCIGAGTPSGLPATDINGDPWANPLTPDIGCDGFQFVDANANGMNDDWEVYYFGNLLHTGVSDTDNDGLTDAQEYTAGTVPMERDTDYDGLPDGWEVARGLNPINPGDAGGDWNGDGIANSNDFQRGSLAIRVTMADPDRNDDTWNLILNNSVVASCNAGNTWYDSKVVYVERGTTVRFMLQRPETGQGGGTDEYQVNFEAADWPSNQAPWIASVSNAALSANLPWNGSTPPDVSGIFWEFTIPTNMLQQNVKAGGTTALTTDPINTINGNITLDESDLAVACPVFDLAFVRAYNSAATASNALGRGWTHSLDWSLATVSNAAYGSRAGTFKVMTTGDGQSYWFCTEAAGSFTLASPQTANLALVFTNGEFRVKWPGGTVARFDASGAIQRLEDGFGTGLTFTHAGAKLTQVAHDNGKALAMSYTGDLLSRVDSPSTNLYVTLSYNADGLLTNAIRMADGVAKSTRYDYENVCHVMTQRVNAAGQVFAYSVGYVTNSPAWNGNPAVVTARGTGMTLDPSGLCWNSHTLSYTNPGGFATRVTYYRGDTNLVHEYAYDPVKMLITSITGPGTPGVAAWSNTWTHFQYDAAQNLTNESLKDGASGDTLEAVAAYDGHHNVLSNSVKYCGNAAQFWSAYSWNADDTLASSTDPAGHKTAFEYTNGLINVVRECTNVANGFETRFFYTTNGLLAAVTNANGHGLGYENDSAGYVRRVIPALGPETRFVRNDLGLVTAVIVPGDAGYRTNALTVNALGQVTAVTYPDGLKEAFAFDILGNLTNMVDTAGRTNVLTWLPTGKPASVSRWLDGPNSTNVSVAFAYDKLFNTLKITDPMGRAVESYKLDAQDRPVSVTNIQNQVMTINWGVGDYVKDIKRFDGTAVTNYYGTDGRLVWTMHPGKMNVFTWTADGELGGVYGYTNSGASWNVDGTQITNGFDILGRRNLEWSVFGGRTNAVAWQFDPVGNVTNIAVSNTLVRYGWTYDAAERPLSLTAQAASNRVSVFQWNYNTNNGLVALVTNTAISESLGYDILDRATNITWKTAGGTTVRGFGYSFNSAGMITNVSRENGGWTAYTYDSLDRLLSEKQFASTGLTYSASWNYDLAGNRTIAITNGVTNLYSYAVGNILTNFGSGTLVQHDLAGNITNLQYSASRKLTLYWNGRYELTEVRTNGVTAEKYDYDPLGRRARIIAGTVTNSFVYSGPHIVAEWSNNVLARSFSHGPGVDNILSMTTYGAATNTYFYLKDAIGSVHALVNTNGTVVEQYKYTAWGEVTVLSSNGTVLAASAYGNRFTFQGREASYSTGLLFFRSRYYSASLGRWLSKDKIGISGGANQYVFCGNNPVNFTDAFGLCESAVGKVERRMSLIWGALSHGEWGALGKDFESQFREYGEMDPAEFALSFNTMGGATKLYRFGASPESVTRLARKAAEALNSNIGIHGVSVSEQAAVGASSAERAVIEKAFKVHDTPTMRDPLHRTVELPNPVTKAVADMFNRLFGRE